ncbi:MAG: nitroreductase family protein [Erysipelotrichaceae bacterium]|nr:nitroreductase family protein [Erysipelotrichaceae bacterium]
MNEVIRTIMSRKSVRSYEDRKIDEQTRKVILEAACSAPTAGNQQMYTIIDVRDQKLKEELVGSCDHQPFIAEGKMVLVFCADTLKWHEGFVDCDCDPRDQGVGDLMLAVTDACIAAQTAVIAAESLGIGSCYIGDIMENCEEQRRILQLPEYVFPCAMLVMGYTTEAEKRREKPKRAPLECIVSVDRYPEMDKDYRRKLFDKGSTVRTYEEWMKAFCERKYNSDFSREMSRSVAEYLKQYSSFRL